jgi:hypothetical protein
MYFALQLGGALLLGIIAGAVSVYISGNYVIKLSEARRSVDDHFFTNLSVEQRMWLSSEGRVLRDDYLNVEERLLYKRFPLTQWMNHKRLLKQSVDADTMIRMAKELSNLAAEAKIPIRASVIRELIGR